MDAKSKANFINSVASGESVPCPKCDTLNTVGAKFCASCGATLDAVPFAPVQAAEPAVENKVAEPQVQYAEVAVEEESVFAEGLPEWNIEPPQVMVRRKRKK